MPVEGSKETLHETLEKAYDSTVGAETAPATGASEAVTTTAAAETTTATTAKETPTATPSAERVRDPATGKFVTKDATAPVKAVPAATVIPAATRLGVKRPDSWKKEAWGIWDKLDAGDALTPEERKSLLDYTHEREGQYTKGVSAYKAEAEHAKRLIEAITPYQQMMQTQGITPEKFITAIANVHQTLSGGNAQEKLRAFARFAQDYQIPLEQLLVQGEDGKVYLNQQYFQNQEKTESQPFSSQDIDRRVQQQLQNHMLTMRVQEFQAAKDASGNVSHPHFEKVRQTMDGLLRSGLAKDLQGAYDAALRLPQHADIFNADQEQTRKTEAEAKAKEEADRVARAKAQVASPRTDSPTGSDKGSGKKGLRSVLSDAYDQHVTGRI